MEVLRDGREAFPAMLEAIAAARRSVHLEMYIFNDDGTGRQFAEALAGAAARGVEVALLYDSLGSWRTHPWIFDWMAANGVRVIGYRPLFPWRQGWGWPRRDHRKLLVIDEAVGFTGGINIGDDWAEVDRGGRGWRDTMVRISGPAARALDLLFREVWDREVRRQRSDLALAPMGGPLPPTGAASLSAETAFAPTGAASLSAETEFGTEADGDGVPVAIVGNREFGRRRAIRKTYRYAIDKARRYIFIANPYFVPDHAILRSLKWARRRGVRVALLLPGQSDIASVQWASRATYEKLLTWGVEIHHWCQPMFHAKTAVIDGNWCTVGTYNLDTQSLRYNLEVTAVIPDRRVAGEIERMFLEDLGRCDRIDLESWRRRPRWWRLPERFFYFFRAWL